MGAKIPSASVTVRAMLTSENLRAEAVVSTVGVPTSVVKTRSHPRAVAGAPPRPWPSEESVDERRDRGAFRQHDQDREQEHGDHDRSQPPLLPNLHEGPELAEDREAIEEATRATRHPSSPCLVGLPPARCWFAPRGAVSVELVPLAPVEVLVELGLLPLQEDLIAEHEYVHVGPHEAAVGIVRRADDR